MSFCTVKYQIEGPTPDGLPEIGNVFADVIFYPGMPYGDGWVVTPETGDQYFVAGTPVRAKIYQGVLTGEYGPIQLFAGGPTSSPSEAWWTISFHNVFIEGQKSHLKDFVFLAAPGATMDLADFIPMFNTEPPVHGIGPQGIKGEPGDKGDLGPRGFQGDPGPQGIQGIKGETGTQGPEGPRGFQGDPGPQGIKGDKGDKGDPGSVTNHTHDADVLTDATAIGKSLIRAATQTAARSTIGAGTSNLAIGTSASTAKAGNWMPTWANVSDKPAEFPSTWDGVANKPTEFVPVSHTHTLADLPVEFVAEMPPTPDPDIIYYVEE